MNLIKSECVNVFRYDLFVDCERDSAVHNTYLLVYLRLRRRQIT